MMPAGYPDALCKHCGRKYIYAHGAFGRCAGGKTQWEPAGVALVAPLPRFRRADPPPEYLGGLIGRVLRREAGLPAYNFDEELYRRGEAAILAALFCNGYYVAREREMLRLEPGMRIHEGWYAPPYTRLRDALAEWVPYVDACRAALAHSRPAPRFYW